MSFFSLGLVVRSYSQKVKLHLTLMNTAFAQEENPNFEHPSTRKRKETFDCTKILEVIAYELKGGNKIYRNAIADNFLSSLHFTDI